MASSFSNSSWVPTAAPTVAPTISSAPTVTPTLAPSFTPTTICCCATVGLGGECYDGSNNLLATCESNFDVNIAECESESGAAMKCYISECPNAKLAKTYALVPQTHCYVIGAVLILLAAMIFWSNAYKVKKEAEGSDLCDSERTNEKNIKKRVEKRIRRFKVSNVSFVMRTSFTLGIELLVLGGISGNYDMTIIILGAFQFLEFITYMWKTIKMVFPNYFQERKERNERKKKEAKANKVGMFSACCTLFDVEQTDPQSNEDEEVEALLSKKEDKYVSPSDIYDDITTPIARVSLLFFCQVILLVLYIYAIYTGGSANFTEVEPYGFFITGVLVQICYQEAKDKQPTTYFNEKKKYWKTVMGARKIKPDHKGREKTGVECVDEDSEHTRFIPVISLRVRIIMSNLINLQGTSMLMYLLPLHLSTSEDTIDFVLNAVAAYIIVELDDAIETEKIKIVPESTGRNGDNTSSSHGAPRNSVSASNAIDSGTSEILYSNDNKN